MMKTPPQEPGGRRRRRLFQAAAFIVAVVLGAALLEISVRVLARAGLVAAPGPPAGSDTFWDGSRERLGVWHHANASLVHEGGCFTSTYRTNSMGARDVERSRQSSASRVLVLGDSFIEGWGLADQDRFTNHLEAVSGMEHLNLGMSHFGPLQSALAYEEFGPAFSHDALIVGVVPYNDFFDLDLDMARQAPAYEYRYRPYLTGEAPDFKITDYREPRLQRLLRRHSRAFNALSHAYHALTGGGLGSGPAARTAEGLSHSWFYDFSDRQFTLLAASLERLLAAAGGRPVAVVLIPVHRDLVRFQQSGEAPLAARLRQLAFGRRLEIVDLLPGMHSYTPRWDRYYFTCDYHWNAFGNATAARMVAERLKSFIYPDNPATERSDALDTSGTSP